MNCPAHCTAGIVIVDREFPIPTVADCGSCPLGQLRSVLATSGHADAARIYAGLRNRRDQLLDSLDELEERGATLAERESRTEKYEAAHAELLAAADIIRKFTGRRPPAPPPAEVLTTPPALFSTTPTQPEET